MQYQTPQMKTGAGGERANSEQGPHRLQRGIRVSQVTNSRKVAEQIRNLSFVCEKPSWL